MLWPRLAFGLPENSLWWNVTPHPVISYAAIFVHADCDLPPVTVPEIK